MSSGAGRTYAGEAAEARTARRRRQLLDAGLELFGTVGYRRSTVRLVCRAAKVADRYFYEEFSGMEELLLSVYHECVDQLVQAVLDAVAGRSEVPDAAQAGLEAFLAAVEADPRLARVVWFEVLGVSRRVEAAYIGRLSAFGELLAGLGLQRGLLAEMTQPERDVLLLAVAGGISQVVVNWVLADFSPPREQLVRPLVAFISAGAAPGPPVGPLGIRLESEEP